MAIGAEEIREIRNRESKMYERNLVFKKSSDQTKYKKGKKWLLTSIT